MRNNNQASRAPRCIQTFFFLFSLSILYNRKESILHVERSMSSYPFFFFGGLKKISKTKLKNKRIRGDDERIESVGQRSPTIKVCVSCWARELYVIYKRRDSSSCKIYRQSPNVYFFCARACLSWRE